MWFIGWKGPSGFSASSTAEQVTHGIDGTSLTAIITGFFSFFFSCSICCVFYSSKIELHEFMI